MSEKTVGITLSAKAQVEKAASDFQGFLNTTQSAAEKTTRQMTEAQRSAMSSLRNYSAAAAAAVTLAAGISIKAAIEAEDAVNKARSSVEVAGGSWDVYGERVTSAASKLQGLTRFSEEELLATFARTVSMTGDVERSLASMGGTADLAAALQIDLASAGDLYSKALTGNVEILGRVLPALKTKLAALGDNATAAEKTALAMAELSKFTGAAGKDAETSSGKWKQVSNQFGEVQEAIGNGLLPLVNKLAEGLLPIVKAVADWAAANPNLSAGILTAAGTFAVLTAAGTALAISLNSASGAATALGISLKAIPGFGWAIAAASLVLGVGAAFLATSGNTAKAASETKNYRDELDELAKRAQAPVTVNIGGAHNFTPEEIAAAEAAREEARNETARKYRAEYMADYERLVGKEGETYQEGLRRDKATRDAAHALEMQDYTDLVGRKGDLYIEGIRRQEVEEQRAKEARAAAYAEEEAFWQGHLSFMGSAFDTFTGSLVNTEMTGKQRREAVIRAGAASAIQQLSRVVKHAIASDVLMAKSKTASAAAGAGAVTAAAATEQAATSASNAGILTGLATKIYSWYASLGPWGVPAAAATIAGIIAAIRALKFAEGGVVPGAGVGDSVPALLTPGEFVVRRPVAERNMPLLQAMNSGRGGGFGGSLVLNVSTDRDASLGDVLRLRRLLEDILPEAMERAVERGAFRPGSRFGGGL